MAIVSLECPACGRTVEVNEDKMEAFKCPNCGKSIKLVDDGEEEKEEVAEKVTEEAITEETKDVKEEVTEDVTEKEDVPPALLAATLKESLEERAYTAMDNGETDNDVYRGGNEPVPEAAETAPEATKSVKEVVKGAKPVKEVVKVTKKASVPKCNVPNPFKTGNVLYKMFEELRRPKTKEQLVVKLRCALGTINCNLSYFNKHATFDVVREGKKYRVAGI